MLRQLVHVAQRFRRNHATAIVAKESSLDELEIRLGSYSNGHFSSGVSHSEFFRLEKDLMESVQLTPDDGWAEVIDYFYVTMHGKNVRTRVETNKYDFTVQTTHVVKDSVSNVVCSCGDECSIRVSHSRETTTSDYPDMCIPTHVRIKQRRSFRDVRDGTTLWVYELSKVWSGSSRFAAEQSQHVAPPTYEVECELHDADGYLAAHDDKYVAESLLLKAQALLGVDEPFVLKTSTTSRKRHQSDPGGGRDVRTVRT